MKSQTHIILVLLSLTLIAAPVLDAGLSNRPEGRLWMTDGVVNATAENTTDNTLYLGGSFTRIMPVTGNAALLNHAGVTDGSIDGSEVENNAFVKLREGCNAIYAVESDGASGWYVGGDFDVTFGGVQYTNLMHIDANGDPDPNWLPNPDGAVRAIAVTAGVIYFGGDFTAIADSPSGGWFDPAWGFRKEITIDSAQVDADLTDFPVLINIAADDGLKSVANGGNVDSDSGDDIVVTDRVGVQLPYEFERYDPTTGELVLWVKADVDATADTVLFLYYGNNAAAAQEDALNVWDASHVAVHHLEESAQAPAGSGVAFLDSTSVAADGTSVDPFVGNVGGVVGQVADCVRFDGGSQVITIPDLAELNPAGEITLSCWMQLLGNSSDTTVHARLIAKDDPDFYALTISDIDDTTKSLTFHVADDSGTPQELVYTPAGTAEWIDLEWHHVAGTYDGSTMRLYIDGVEVASLATGAFNFVSGADGAVAIGNTADTTSARHFNGNIDEVRIEDSGRSGAWISASYRNQNDPSAFYEIGSQELFKPVSNKLAAVDAATGVTELNFVAAPDDTVRAIVVDAAGNLYIGGDFANVDDATGTVGVLALAKLDATGTVDTAFPVAADGHVNALVLDSDESHLFVGGLFTDIDDGMALGESNCAAVTVAGAVVDADIVPDGEVFALASDGVGLVYLGGDFSDVNGGTTRNLVAAVDEVGAVDAGTDPDLAGGNASVRSLSYVAPSFLYIGGDFTTVDTTVGASSHKNLVCWDTAAVGPAKALGTDLDTYLEPTGDDSPVYAIANDGTDVLVGGVFMSVSGIARSNLAELDFDLANASYGQPTSWNPDADGGVDGLLYSEPLGAQLIWVSGNFTELGTNDIAVVNLGAVDIAGSTVLQCSVLDAALMPANVNAMVQYSADETVIGGDFADVAMVLVGVGVQFAASPDKLFLWDAGDPTNPAALGDPLGGDVHSLALDAADVYVGGTYTSIGGELRNGAAVWDGAAIDVAWDPNVTMAGGIAGSVRTIEVGADKVYLGGDFSKVNGTAMAKLAAVEKANGVNTGLLDGTFVPVGNPGGTVNALLLVGDDTLLVGGAFANFGVSLDQSLVTLDATTGALDTSFTPIPFQTGKSVASIAIHSDIVLVGGTFQGRQNLDRANYFGEFPSPIFEVREDNGAGVLISDDSAAAGQRLFATTPTNIASGDSPITIYIENTTGGELVLGTPSMAGTDAADFTIDTTGFDSTLGAGESTTFMVSFVPQTSGTKDDAQVEFTHNSEAQADPPPFSFNVEGVATAPAMTITESTTGGSIPNDGSGELDFGTVDFNIIGASGTVTVTIENTDATTDLTLGTPALSGGDAADFVLDVTGFTTPLPAGDTTTFTIGFDPVLGGEKSASISFTHNDPGNAPFTFTFALVGEGDEPTKSVFELDSASQQIPIADHATPAGGRNFGSLIIGNTSDPVTIQVVNLSGLNVNLGTPSITGTGANEFTLDTTNWLQTVPGDTTVSFDIVFEPTSQGTFTPLVSFTHNDLDDVDAGQNPPVPEAFTYDFEITGTASFPAPLSITPTTLIDGLEGVSYGPQVLTGSGGTPGTDPDPAYTWTIDSGILPPGIDIEEGSTTLTLSGTPPIGSRGLYTFSVRVEDSVGETESRTLRIFIDIPGIPLPAKTQACTLRPQADQLPLVFVVLSLATLLVLARRRKTL